jgi:hypothetical protein
MNSKGIGILAIAFAFCLPLRAQPIRACQDTVEISGANGCFNGPQIREISMTSCGFKTVPKVEVRPFAASAQDSVVVHVQSTQIDAFKANINVAGREGRPQVCASAGFAWSAHE